MWIRTPQGFANMDGVKTIVSMHTREGYIVEANLLGETHYVRLATFNNEPDQLRFMRRIQATMKRSNLLIDPYEADASEEGKPDTGSGG